MTDTEISSLDHCTGRQLKELLELAHSDARATQDWLLEIGDAEELEHVLDEMFAGGGQSGGALVLAVLSPDTPVEALTAIRSTAKRLAAAAQGSEQNAGATLLYHLSIAAALGHHRQNISSKDPADRLELYKDLAAELPDHELAAIFEKAVAALVPPKS